MKHLPKHLRPRWRYLAVGIEAWPDADVDRRDFQRSVWFAAGNLLGDAASADADLRVLGFSFADGEGEAVIRVRRGEVGPARAALACVDAVRDDPVGVHVRGVGGTVHSCEEKFLGRIGDGSTTATVRFDGAEREAVRRDDAVDVRTNGGFVGACASDVE